MNSYMFYVHDIPVGASMKLPWVKAEKKAEEDYKVQIETRNELQRAIFQQSSVKVLNYVSQHLDLARNFRNIIFSSREKSFVDDVDFNNVRAIVNFKHINEIKHVNQHFQSVNTLLPKGGVYIGRGETYGMRKFRFYRKFGQKLGQAVWLMDFAINRVIPKMRVFDKIYTLFTNKRIHRRSRTELLGRIVYAGFKIIDYTYIDDMLYFVAEKKGEPLDDPEPTYRPLVKLRRVGKNGKIINVYKFRTMHPYAEYLQDYLVEKYGYNDKGKPNNDFRVTRWGRMMRKLWIDEMPQLLNVLKGEMKLVGVRPLSRVRYSEFPVDMQEERIKYKPGCFPPYVALCMPDENGNIEAERIYLKDKAARPYTTDIRYFAKSVYNILANKIRSS